MDFNNLQNEYVVCPSCSSNDIYFAGHPIGHNAYSGMGLFICASCKEHITNYCSSTTMEVDDYDTIDKINLSVDAKIINSHTDIVQVVENLQKQVIELTRVVEADADDPMRNIRKKISSFSLEEKKVVYSIDNPPPYVCMGGGSHLRYRRVENNFYVDAGNWAVDWTFIDGKFFSVSDSSALHGKELVPCSKEEWLSKNRNYYNGE